MSNLFVKPAQTGLLVRDPHRGDYIEASGRYVPSEIYWHRRIADGDVIVVSDPEASDPEIDEKTDLQDSVDATVSRDAPKSKGDA